ncbi:ATP-binding protein [Candidatus Woesearchaeota archaeon]|nr:ATP-binding protein [Candidatus Woesearchaeota archaeon]
MILGRLIGKASTTQFQFQVMSAQTKKFQFIQVHHPDYGFVLGQVMELLRTENDLTAQCNVIGFKDVDHRIKGIRTPFAIGSEVLEAEDSFIQSVIELDGDVGAGGGGFLGRLEGKTIPVNIDLQKLLTKHLCVLAKSGAGKSYAVGVLIEEIVEKGVPVLIIDPHGEYAALKFPTEEKKEILHEWGIEAQGYGAKVQEYGNPHTKEDVRPLKLSEKMNSSELMKILPIQLSNAQEAMLFSVIKDMDEINFDGIILGLQQLNAGGKWNIIDTLSYLRNLKLFSPSPTPFSELIRPGKITIINLRGITPEVQEVVVYRLLQDLFLERKQEKIPPFFCILEEAHNFVPEKGFGRAKSADVIRLISSEGRKFGLGLCVVSQRPALVQKTVLAQCSTQLIMKVTNPNDLRAIVGSIEGITAETEQEIQNLPIGSALLCGMVDRPLVVQIRPRRSQHGGHAIDILGSVEEYGKDIVEEAQKFEEQGLLPLVKPHLEKKDLLLMANGPVTITTYLIPACLVRCEIKGMEIAVLVDKIKGRIILDPEKDLRKEIHQLDESCGFFRKIAYENIEYDVKLDEKIPEEELKKMVEKYCMVLEVRNCFIVYYKVA